MWTISGRNSARTVSRCFRSGEHSTSMRGFFVPSPQPGTMGLSRTSYIFTTPRDHHFRTDARRGDRENRPVQKYPASFSRAAIPSITLSA
jgi:hypothetical protein